jgi:hypothetical protein
MRAIFGFASVELAWNRIAVLCLKQHGGSGYNFTRADVLDMDVDEIEWYIDELRRRRTEESNRIAAAAADARSGSSSADT